MNHPFMTVFADLIGSFLILMNHLGLNVIITLIRIIWKKKNIQYYYEKVPKEKLIMNVEKGNDILEIEKSIIMDHSKLVILKVSELQSEIIFKWKMK